MSNTGGQSIAAIKHCKCRGFMHPGYKPGRVTPFKTWNWYGFLIRIIKSQVFLTRLTKNVIGNS